MTMDHLRALRVLGLPAGASAADIRTAWLDLSKVWHPDRFQNDERLQKKAGENLARINEAREALADYDPAIAPPIAARVRASVAIILGMGEVGGPRTPIGLRRSLRVLGLSGRDSAAMDTPTPRGAATGILFIVLAALLAGLVFLWVL
jgi:hypothetical protein